MFVYKLKDTSTGLGYVNLDAEVFFRYYKVNPQDADAVLARLEAKGRNA